MVQSLSGKYGWGLLLAFCIAAAAYGLGKAVPVVGGPVFGILLGMIAAGLWRVPQHFEKGLKFTSKYILQLAVILLGFEMNMQNVIAVGRQSIWVILATLTAAFVTAVLVGRALGVQRKLTALIGLGTAICGGSAIAAASSAIDANDQEISYSISTIFLFNVAAVFLFPFVGRLLHLSDAGFGMWAGTAINDTSSVVAAAYSFSPAAGTFATVVKLTRSLMIVPVTLALAVVYARSRQHETAFHFSRIFPWFVLGFLAASLVSTFASLPEYLVLGLTWTGRFLIVMAMAAIGLNTNRAAFRTAGPRALVLGAATWLAVMLSSLAIQSFSNIW